MPGGDHRGAQSQRLRYRAQARALAQRRERQHSCAGLSQAASSLENAVRENALPAIGGLVTELTEKLAAVNAELRQVG